MIGWFSLSVPSALGLYWILNNFISTGTSVLIRKQVRGVLWYSLSVMVQGVCGTRFGRRCVRGEGGDAVRMCAALLLLF